MHLLLTSKMITPMYSNVKSRSFCVTGATTFYWHPSCPELQLIELFWAAGKNYVMHYQHDQTMQNVVTYFREGWYGNWDTNALDSNQRKRLVNCCTLWAKCLSIVGTKFVQLCEGISGVIGNLEVDPKFTYESVTLPIDTLVVYFTREDADDDEFGAIENI